jgi:hypothetical protein
VLADSKKDSANFATTKATIQLYVEQNLEGITHTVEAQVPKAQQEVLVLNK